jgi:hypothetical protein
VGGIIIAIAGAVGNAWVLMVGNAWVLMVEILG